MTGCRLSPLDTFGAPSTLQAPDCCLALLLVTRQFSLQKEDSVPGLVREPGGFLEGVPRQVSYLWGNRAYLDAYPLPALLLLGLPTPSLSVLACPLLFFFRRLFPPSPASVPLGADLQTLSRTADAPGKGFPHLVLSVETGLDAEIGAHQGAYHSEGCAHRPDRRCGSDLVFEDHHRHRVHERDDHDGGQDEEETPRLGRR